MTVKYNDDGEVGVSTPRKTINKNTSAGAAQNPSALHRVDQHGSVSVTPFQNLASLLPDIVFQTDAKGNIIFLNQPGMQAISISPQDLSRRIKPEDLFVPHDRKRLQYTMKRCLDGLFESPAKYKLMMKDKIIRPVMVHVKPILENGRCTGSIGVIGDLSSLKDAESKLKNAEEKFKSLFENTGLPMAIIEGDMTVSMVNAKFVELTGYEKGAVQGMMKFQEFVEEEDRGLISGCLRGMKGGLPAGYECRISHRNGEKIDVIVRLGAIQKTDQAIASFLDISTRKQAEAIRRESQEHPEKGNIYIHSSIKERYRFGDIIGKSFAMQEVYEFILKAAANPANVIIYGESGTGKELVARAIHGMSDRCARNFVTVNCGAIPENIIESEFFGHKKGAFTSAHANKPGYLDYADGGTLFLDEVGEIGLSMQVKLLRIIEGSGYMPVGSNQSKNSNVRIIAATNRNPRDMVKKGLMREDFFYRIHILPIYLPALHERKDDIPLLVEHFMNMYSKHHAPISGKVMEALCSYDWPGNVRELQNVLHRYVTLKKLDFMSSRRVARDLTEPDAQGHGPGTDMQSAMDSMEKELIQKTLHRYQWHRGRVAQALNINRKTLFLKMRKYGLVKP